ncbi:Imm45 family immunity protein [Microbacterium maritypicum]
MLLEDYKVDLVRGDRLRIVSAPNGADHRELLIAEAQQPDSGCALWVIDGYKAGLVFQVLPRESRPAEGPALVDVDWLKLNWSEWVNPDWPLSQIAVRPWDADDDI